MTHLVHGMKRSIYDSTHFSTVNLSAIEVPKLHAKSVLRPTPKTMRPRLYKVARAKHRFNMQKIVTKK